VTLRIAIIGTGHVGNAMNRLLAPHARLVTYDISDGQDYPDRALAACDAAIICVDTPAASDGSCDTSHVRAAVQRVPVSTVLIKSTVPPGTTDLLADLTGKQVCFSPEYYGQPAYHHPWWPGGPGEVPFIILGGDPTARRHLIDLLQPVLGPAITYFQCTAIEAETIKYMENAYLAAKVTFVNEFRRICAAVGADWHTVREGWLLDPRVGPSHTAALASDPGFGGRCLPKDLAALIRAAEDAGYHPALLTQIMHSNREFRDVDGQDSYQAPPG
jgi:UDPglucose 6-dehydrogenase